MAYQKIDSSERKIHDEAPTNEGVDGLRHFEKTIRCKEKYEKERPRMEGWTICGLLKNRFILETNTQCSAQK